MGFLEDITNIGKMLPKVDTENPPEKLDKVEKALDQSKAQRAELQKNIGQQDPKKVEEVITPLKQGAFADFAEAGITETADQEKYWGVMEEFIKKEIAKDTIEFREIEDLVNNNENLKVLKETLQSKDPLAKAKNWIAKIKAFPFFGAWILGFAHDTLIKWSKNKEGKDIPGAEEMRDFAALLVDKKDTKPKTPEEEAKEKNKPLIDVFTKNGFTEATATTVIPTLAAKNALLDQGKLEEDLQFLKALKWDDAKVTEALPRALAENGKLGKLLQEISKRKGTLEDKITVHLRFLHFDSFSDDKIATLVSVLNGSSKDYEIKNKTTAGRVEFLDDSLKQTELTDSIDKYKIVPPAPATKV